MKVELKQIIDQLTDLLELNENVRVSAIVNDETDVIVGWTIVNVHEDGAIEPAMPEHRFDTIKEMVKFWKGQ